MGLWGFTSRPVDQERSPLWLPLGGLSDESDGADKSDGRTPRANLPAVSIPASVRGVPPPLYFAEGDPTEDPDRGVFFIDRVLRHEVPKIARDAILDKKRQEET